MLLESAVPAFERPGILAPEVGCARQDVSPAGVAGLGRADRRRDLDDTASGSQAAPAVNGYPLTSLGRIGRATPRASWGDE